MCLARLGQRKYDLATPFWSLKRRCRSMSIAGRQFPLYKTRFMNYLYKLDHKQEDALSPIVKPTSETSQTLANFPLPTWLKHTPWVAVPYEHFDGPYSEYTDAKYLGIGLAQWRTPTDDPHAVSIKSWRKPDERWSRQSEELPLHRHVDMTILLAYALASNTNPIIDLPSGTFESQDEPITLRKMVELPDECARDLERGRSRLRKLRQVLNELDIYKMEEDSKVSPNAPGPDCASR